MKTIKFLLAFIFFPFSIQSQINFDYGIKGGVVSANHITSSKENTDHRIGADIGIFIEPVISKYISISAELHFIQKGMSYTYDSGNTLLNYLSIPVLFKLKTGFSQFYPYLVLGPRIDFLISKNEWILKGYYENLNNFNYGGSVGIGTEIKILKYINLLAELRYDLDFNYFFVSGYTINNNMIANQSGGKQFNQSWDFLVGVKF